MDAFRLLSGGTRFDKKRFLVDQSESPIASTSTSLPAELDFFGAVGESKEDEKAERKRNKKRRRLEETAAVELEKVDFNLILKKFKIKLSGLDLPNPILSLSQLKSHIGWNDLFEINWNKIGMGELTAVQMAAWSILLQKRDGLICAPTGSGKTLAFILPLLLLHSPNLKSTKVFKPTCLILEPTRELAMQVCRETLKISESGGWNVKVLGEEERAKAVKKVKSKKLKKAKVVTVVVKESEEESEEETVEESAVVESENIAPVDILITTPLRLIYAIKDGSVDLSSILHLILDEADKLFELNFIEQTDEIIAACSHPDLRKGMFSATMPSGVEELAKSVMGGGGVGLIRAIIGQKDAATETIDQSLQFVGTEDHKLLALRTLITSGSFTPPVLIFVQSILRAKELSTELLFDGVNADSIHADRSIEERDQVVKDFAEGKIWCLICTDVMGRGVDFKGVKLVINYDFPQSGGSYIHRIGRTGRAGKKGKAITFFTVQDGPHLKSIVNVMKSSGCEVPQFMLEMKNPSQREKKNLRLKPINRQDVRQSNGAGQSKTTGTRKVVRNRIMGGASVIKEKKSVIMDE